MKNVLVTGGAGFIGSTLVRALLSDEEVRRVAVVDDFSTGKRENLAEVEGSIELHRLDIRDAEAIRPTFDDIDVVFHLAAVASVPRSISEPLYCHQVNADGTFNVIESARQAGVRRIVFASTSAAYGDSPELPKRETMTPAPRSAYAAQKLLGEHYLSAYQATFGIETVALRFFNVFGPRQDPSSPYSGVLSLFCDAVLKRQAPTIFGDGEQSRDFIFVDDVVRLLIAAARSPQASGKVYNGGNARRVSVNEVWLALQQIEGVELPPVYGPARGGDVRDSEADISAACGDLGFEPKVSLEEGLRRTLNWRRTYSAA